MIIVVIFAVLRIMDPGSVMGRKSASGSGIRDEQPGSYFLELRNHFLGLIETVRIRDGKKSDPGSGINIPDTQHLIFGSFSFICFYASDVLVLHNVDPLVFQSVLWIHTGFKCGSGSSIFLSLRIQVPVGTVPCRSAEH